MVILLELEELVEVINLVKHQLDPDNPEEHLRPNSAVAKAISQYIEHRLGLRLDTQEPSTDDTIVEELLNDHLARPLQRLFTMPHPKRVEVFGRFGGLALYL